MAAITGYRNDASGIQMCVVVRNRDNSQALFSECTDYGTYISFGPKRLEDGKRDTRPYNKNNNVTIGTERRWLYASTKPD